MIDNIDLRSLEESFTQLFAKGHSCGNCWHYREGYCKMFSCECATQESRHDASPRWWTSYADGNEQERRVLSSG